MGPPRPVLEAMLIADASMRIVGASMPIVGASMPIVGAVVSIVGAAASIVGGRGIVRWVGAPRLCDGIAGGDQIVGKSFGQAVADTLNEVTNGEAIHERRGRRPRNPNTNAPLRIKTRRVHDYLKRLNTRVY
jgi:hypothetical protein